MNKALVNCIASAFKRNIAGYKLQSAIETMAIKPIRTLFDSDYGLLVTVIQSMNIQFGNFLSDYHKEHCQG